MYSQQQQQQTLPFVRGEREIFMIWVGAIQHSNGYIWTCIYLMFLFGAYAYAFMHTSSAAASASLIQQPPPPKPPRAFTTTMNLLIDYKFADVVFTLTLWLYPHSPHSAVLPANSFYHSRAHCSPSKHQTAFCQLMLCGGGRISRQRYAMLWYYLLWPGSNIKWNWRNIFFVFHFSLYVYAMWCVYILYFYLTKPYIYIYIAKCARPDDDETEILYMILWVLLSRNAFLFYVVFFLVGRWYLP